jgi:pimeloyl-ACP methyl ester carboxylesterase
MTMTAEMTGDQATAQWLAEMWARKPSAFGVEAEGAGLACLGWNLEAADRPGIVLVHGFRAHAHWWDHIAPALAGDHRVVAFSLSGMGDSEWRDAYARAQHGREVLAVAAAAGIARPIIVAHSYGALASLLACRAAPERVRRIIVLDSALPTAEEALMQIPTPPLRTYPDRATAIARFRLIPPGGWPQPDIVRHIAEHSVMPLPDGRWSWKFDNDMARTLNREDYRPAMLGVPVPTDILYGDRTEIFTPARIAAAAEILPNCAPYVALPAAHHHVMIEQPIALVAALRAMLATPKG